MQHSRVAFQHSQDNPERCAHGKEQQPAWRKLQLFRLQCISSDFQNKGDNYDLQDRIVLSLQDIFSENNKDGFVYWLSRGMNGGVLRAQSSNSVPKRERRKASSASMILS